MQVMMSKIAERSGEPMSSVPNGEGYSDETKAAAISAFDQATKLFQNQLDQVKKSKTEAEKFFSDSEKSTQELFDKMSETLPSDPLPSDNE